MPQSFVVVTEELKVPAFCSPKETAGRRRSGRPAVLALRALEPSQSSWRQPLGLEQSSFGERTLPAFGVELQTTEPSTQAAGGPPHSYKAWKIISHHWAQGQGLPRT